LFVGVATFFEGSKISEKSYHPLSTQMEAEVRQEFYFGGAQCSNYDVIDDVIAC